MEFFAQDNWNSAVNTYSNMLFKHFFLRALYLRGHVVAHSVAALRYKPIPDGVTGIIHRHNPSGRTMTLGSHNI